MIHCFNEILLWNVESVCKSDSGWWVVVEMWENHSLRGRWFIVNTCASFSVSTRSNLEVERTVDLILLCSEYFCQALCHC